jgi:uncharacterized metal-binding protein
VQSGRLHSAARLSNLTYKCAKWKIAQKSVQSGRLHKKVCKVEDCTKKCAKWKIAQQNVQKGRLHKMPDNLGIEPEKSLGRTISANLDWDFSGRGAGNLELSPLIS